MMQAGKLRHRLVIESYTQAVDIYGEPIPTWATLVTRWGSVEPLSGRELLQAQEIRAETTHRVRLRYYSGLRPEQRIKFGTRYLHILAIINPRERNAEMELLCKEAV